MTKSMTQGVFQVGVLVSDIDECIRLFCGCLGMKIVFEARNQIQPAKGLAGVENQVMNVLMLHGEGGVDLEIHQYVNPKAIYKEPMNHNDLGSMHFMLRVDDIEATVKEIEKMGYSLMNPIVSSARIPEFKFTYFRGPDGMMIELHQGKCEMPKKEM